MKIIIGVVIGVVLAVVWLELTVKAIECHDETIVERGEFWHKDKKYKVREVE